MNIIDEVNGDRLAEAEVIRFAKIKRVIAEVQQELDTVLRQEERATEARQELRRVTAKPQYAEQKDDVRRAMHNIELGESYARTFASYAVRDKLPNVIGSDASEFLDEVSEKEKDTYKTRSVT